MDNWKELQRFAVLGASRVDAGAYETNVERNEEGWFCIQQSRNAGAALVFKETDDMVMLDPASARALYLTLKNHFEA